MQRILVGGLALLLCGVISARSKPEPLVFVFLRVDQEQGVAILRPMIPPDIAVQLDSGSRSLRPGTVLQCAASTRTEDALVESQIAKITELVLDCGDQKFVVKALDFRPQRK